MTSSIDLYLLPISRQFGQDNLTLAGLYVATRPRRPARSRRNDHLILYLVMEGSAPFTPEQQEKILSSLGQSFYKTPGSVTTAMRKMADTLNQYLLERNMGSARSGQQTIGSLSIITIHNDHLFLGQCGPTDTFLIGVDETRHLYDASDAKRGLGISRSTAIEFAQASLNSNDTLLVSHDPPSDWDTNTLQALYGKKPQDQRAHLLHQVSDLNTLILQATPGSGKIQQLRPEPIPAGKYAAAEVQEELAKKMQTPEQPLEEVSDEEIARIAAIPDMPSEWTTEPASVEAQLASSHTSLDETAFGLESHSTQPAMDISSTEIGEREVGSQTAYSPRRSIFAPIAKALLVIGSAISNTIGGFTHGISSLFKRILPGEGLYTLPSSLMAFFAIAIPLIVVAVATVIYFQRGLASQYEAYYLQANEVAELARSQSDPQAQREAWQSVIALIDQAETYQVAPESQALRSEAQRVIDEMDVIRRIAYQPAIVGGLPENLEITRMAANESDLYLLDRNEGKVWRTLSTGRGYEVDPTFQCGPGYYENQGVTVGPLIDITLPRVGSGIDATIVAMDVNGNLLKCASGKSPDSASLFEPIPNWEEPHNFMLDMSDLYVLDSQTNKLWIYWNGQFTQEPELFFIETTPPMQDAVDFTLDKGDLYLLHEDGHLTLCTYSNLDVSPTRCAEETYYVDSRPGRENLIMIPESPFTQILATQPPDPSLYLFAPNSQAIYHYSLRQLAFHRQLRPFELLEEGESASAFTLSPDTRLAFMAIGNNVYYAGIP